MANLVFIHGSGEDRRIWDRQVAAFEGAHRVLAVDLPGHGTRLADPPLTSHEANAQEALAQMDRAGIPRAVLAGHSMGGAVALMAALDHPERVAGLVLVATGARLRMRQDFLDKARRRAEDPTAPDELPVPLELTVAASAPSEVREWIRARAMTAPPKTISADFQANNQFDVMERLGAIAAPTLVVGADEDRMTPLKYSQYLAERVPGARLVVCSPSGHYPQVEQEARFNRALAEFLRLLA